jgi:hypothetical protein
VIMFRLWRLTTILKNRTFILLFIADMISMFAEEWGSEAPALRDKLAPKVRRYRAMAARVKPSDIGQLADADREGA